MQQDTELDAEDLQILVTRFKPNTRPRWARRSRTSRAQQLIGAVRAVFRSWNNERAIVYPPAQRHPLQLGHRGQRPVDGLRQLGRRFGHRRPPSRATPRRARKSCSGEFLINAQGEDVVAGIRTPQSIDALAERMPAVYEQFAGIADTLEKH